MRTVYTIGPINNSATFYQRTSFVSNIQGGTAELHIDGSKFRYTADATAREGEAATGIFPAELVGAATAALPDTIPAAVRFWVLDASTSRSQEVLITVTGRAKATVPVPVDGGTCKIQGKTKKIAVDVLTLTRRVATSVENIRVLETRPHLLIDENMICVSAPMMRTK